MQIIRFRQEDSIDAYDRRCNSEPRWPRPNRPSSKVSSPDAKSIKHKSSSCLTPIHVLIELIVGLYL